MQARPTSPQLAGPSLLVSDNLSLHKYIGSRLQDTQKHAARACPSPTVTATNYECAYTLPGPTLLQSENVVVGCCNLAGRSRTPLSFSSWLQKSNLFFIFTCALWLGLRGLFGTPKINSAAGRISRHLHVNNLRLGLFQTFVRCLFRVAPCRSTCYEPWIRIARSNQKKPQVLQ